MGARNQNLGQRLSQEQAGLEQTGTGQEQGTGKAGNKAGTGVIAAAEFKIRPAGSLQPIRWAGQSDGPTTTQLHSLICLEAGLASPLVQMKTFPPDKTL